MIEIAAKTTDEPRFMVIGKIAGIYWDRVITYRGEKISLVKTIQPSALAKVKRCVASGLAFD